LKCSSQFFNHVDNRWRVKEKNDSKSSCISLKPNYLWSTRYSKQYHTIWEKSPCYPLKSTINHCWPLKQQLINSFWNTSKDTRHERDFVHFFHAKLIWSNRRSDDSNSAAQKAQKHCSNDRRRLEINDLVHCLFWSRLYKSFILWWSCFVPNAWFKWASSIKRQSINQSTAWFYSKLVILWFPLMFCCC
jgi:hypothetical protein